MKQPIAIFDSTLRDGAQAEGIFFSADDKVNIARKLDQLGVAYIEAGNPGSNPKDLEFFRRMQAMPLEHAALVAFGSTCRKGIPPEDDANCAALLDAGVKTVAIFGKSWDLHVTHVLQTTLEENLRMIEETIAFLTAHGCQVFFDAEHFFDGYRANPDYALDTLQAAARGGAACLVLCDTNGGCFPHEIGPITQMIVEQRLAPVGIHCHNDLGCAVANSIAAVQAGAVQVQGTCIGFGERCGNANLSTIMAALQLKLGYDCIPPESMARLTHTARYVAEVSNYDLPGNTPMVGKSAFAHKGGMHVDGVQKLSSSFELIHPMTVGNQRTILLSEVAGRTALAGRISQIDPTITRDAPVVAQVVEELKDLEHRGYQFESAEASLEILLLKKLGRFKPFFELENFRIIGEQQAPSAGFSPSHAHQNSSAMVKIRVGERTEITAAEGDGPVHALDRALRKALEVFYPTLRETRLVDFKVRVVEQRAATASVVRVLIETTDGSAVWTTVGASADLIEASWNALADSVQYKLLRDVRNGTLQTRKSDDNA